MPSPEGLVGNENRNHFLFHVQKLHETPASPLRHLTCGEPSGVVESHWGHLEGGWGGDCRALHITPSPSSQDSPSSLPFLGIVWGTDLGSNPTPRTGVHPCLFPTSAAHSGKRTALWERTWDAPPLWRASVQTWRRRGHPSEGCPLAPG